MDEVAAILRCVAMEVVLPRFRALRDSEIAEKSPGEIVTVVDGDVERFVAPQLTALLAGSRVVGEEAASARPALLDGLDQGDVWILDPLDGTGNFVAGNADFAVMLALLRDGETVAAWILHPVSGRLAVAARGEGAFIDGVRVRTSALAVPLGACRGSVLTGFLPAALKEQVAEHSHLFFGDPARHQMRGRGLSRRRHRGAEFPDVLAAVALGSRARRAVDRRGRRPCGAPGRCRLPAGG